MKLKFSKWIFILFIFLYTFFYPILSYAAVEEPTVNSPSCILLDINTGTVIYSKNANEVYYPASTTKVMTAILALENCNLTDMATVSHNAIYSVPYSYTNAALVEDEEISVKDLLYALLVPSANDAAFVLAEHIGGSVENFANMMNAKAKEIGCKNTHFVNPNGIHDENHYSTAYDLALIGQYAMKNEVFKKIVSTTIYTLPTTNKYDSTDRIFTTTNELIKTSSKYYYKYATGCKTGYTDAAKFCIIATAKKDDVELLAVVLSDSKAEDGTSLREVDCKTLFEYGFNNFSVKNIVNTTDTVATINVSGATSKTKSLDLNPSENINAFVSNDFSLENAFPKITLNENITAPILKDTVLGFVEYDINGTVYSTKLIASHDVYKSKLLKYILELFLVIIISIFAFIILRNRQKHRKKIKNTNYSSKKNSIKSSNTKKRTNTKLSHLDYYNQYHKQK